MNKKYIFKYYVYTYIYIFPQKIRLFLDSGFIKYLYITQMRLPFDDF